MKHLVKWFHDPTDSSGVSLLNDVKKEIGWDVDVLGIKEYPDNFEIFRVIVAGGRYYNNFHQLTAELDFLLSEKEKTHAIVIVSGKAKGADSLGEEYAKLRGYLVDDHPAAWDIHGKSAGYKRNVEMAENADALVAFWDGISRGTKHMIDIATNKGLPTRVVRY
jgi:hypothetical protein